MKKFRTPWIDVPLQVAFEETEMQVTLRGGIGLETRLIATPVFRLPDGTEFTGRRIGPELRTKIARACKPKGIRK